MPKIFFKNKFKFSKYTFAQIVFLVANFYAQNSLYTCAAACAYSFFVSVIPIVMMTLASIVWIVRSSPEMIAEVIEYAQQIQYMSYLDVPDFVTRVLEYGHLSFVNIISVVFAVWMARKLFATTMWGMRLIFRNEAKGKAFIYQLIVIAGEVVFVLVAVAVILVLYGMRLLLTLPVFSMIRGHIEWISAKTSLTIVNLVAYSLIFIFVSLVYRFLSRTKPDFRLCVLSSAICTSVFFAVTRIMMFFLNVSHYNLIYGVLSGVMILLLEVYIFFLIFFAGAQFIYVVQFFSTLLIGELYLLPPHDATDMKSVLRRVLFITPDVLMDKDDVIYCARGDVIYNDGDKSDDVYYIAQGAVAINRENEVIHFERGDFFGAVNCLLGSPRDGTAVAITECKLIKFSADTFRYVVEKNPQTAEKALERLTIYK